MQASPRSTGATATLMLTPPALTTRAGWGAFSFRQRAKGRKGYTAPAGRCRASPQGMPVISSSLRLQAKTSPRSLTPTIPSSRISMSISNWLSSRRPRANTRSKL
ncbi:Uncharacterised protein [Flavonifractor plautii]|uniref:Uncharacterized protein n=1 Tax=Flavonifractor plautii TaxID=292800 RepID=A0A174PJ63_FLAPL|nr:Uncharacterised protein [Flavonifractor plautii]